MDDEEVIAATIREIAEFAPEVKNAKVVHSQVHHVPMAIHCPTVGTESCRPKTETPISGLFLAGDWTQTALPCTMESAVRSGWLAAESPSSHLGMARSFAKPVRDYDGISWIMRRARTFLR